MLRLRLILSFVLFTYEFLSLSAQNVGVGLVSPEGKFHIKGSEDDNQLIIDANSAQSNTNPLIKLRKSDGTDLLWIHSDHSTNVFVGLNAGRLNFGEGGNSNSFIGSNAGYSNLNGDDNTALGSVALYTNSTGNLNTAIGSSALYKNTIGNLNVANGAGAMYWNTKGSNNVALGSFSLDRNTTASNNIAIGTNALYTQSYSNSNTIWISNNMAIGYEALYANEPTSNTNGTNNAAVGNSTMRFNTTGKDNTAVGESALYSNTIGNNNTTTGRQSLFSNTDGDNNTSVGWKSLYDNTTGNDNTAIGNDALSNNISGVSNTGVGAFSLLANTTGIQNTALGRNAYFTNTSLNNTTCIGYNSGGVVNADNRIEIGNTSVSWIGGQVAWSTYSDGRIKDNVQEDVSGLSFINRLRPVTYNLNIHRQNEMTGKEGNEGDEWATKYDIEKIRMTGFIAQEVEQAAREAGYDFSGVEKPNNQDELYSIRYSEFVMPLVKAVQELSAKNEAQTVMIDAMQLAINQLTQRLTELESNKQ